MKKKYQVKKLLELPISVGEKFYHQTKISQFTRHYSAKSFTKKRPVITKEYTRLDKIILPKPGKLNNAKWKTVLNKRDNFFGYNNKQLGLDELSDILFYSAGIKKAASPLRRFYSSPDGKFPLETYFVSLNTELPRGIYHYNIRSHCLEKIKSINTFKRKDFFNFTWLSKTSGIIIVTAVFKRITEKYGDRGYRHIFTEAGYLGQNFYLNCAALNLGSCGIDDYHEDNLSGLLNLDASNESVVFVLSITTKPG